MFIAALYVQTNGHYFGIEDVDPWDELFEKSNRKLAEKNAADAKVLKEAIGKLGP
jgi:hypothetical protein